MQVVGRDGIDLHEQWDGDARAYLGIIVPNFPNFFMLYGPNTNIVVNGSIIYFSECEVHYIHRLRSACLLEGASTRSTARGRARPYNLRIDRATSRGPGASRR